MACTDCPVSLVCLGQTLRRTRCNRCLRIIVSDALRLPLFTAYILPPDSCPDTVSTSILLCPYCTSFGGVKRGYAWRDFKRKRHRGFVEMIRKP